MPFEACFAGKKALVTGAARGIGRAVVAALHKRGAIVHALAKNQENLNSLKKEFQNIVPVCVDLSNWDETTKALAPLECMDILINNAGVAILSDFKNTSPEDFDMQMNVNVKAVINVSQIVTKKMIAEGRRGAIVNVASIDGVLANPSYAAYSCSKAALGMLSKVMAIELGPQKITVNYINPAQVVTDMHFDWINTASKASGQNPDEMRDSIMEMVKSRTPTTESVMPMDDVVNTILFFASGITSQITGSSLAVDGGFLIA